MKKRCIGAVYGKSNGVVAECWQGGSITEVAFQARYDDGYEIVHSCQDALDEDVFHYIFQKEDSNEPLGYCGMCRTRLAPYDQDDRDTKNTLVIRVPKGVPDIFTSTTRTKAFK